MTHSSSKRAQTSVPILDCIAERWSPSVLDPRPIPTEQWVALFEAARWAASSYNEQPWRFLVARHQDKAAFAAALDCLVEANQAWARRASALVLTAVARTFSRNGTPNRVAEHDLGLAVGNLCAQATAMGLVVHQMGGINLSKVRQTYAIPDGFDPVTAIAIGYPGDLATAEAAIADRDRAPRSRKSLSEFVFGGAWGEPAKWSD